MKKTPEKIRVARLNAAIAKVMATMRPPEQLTVSEWADKYRRLLTSGSAELGRWRTSRTPYLKEVMDAFTDPRVHHIVFVSASQVGKSECINNMIGYAITQDPSSILFVHPTKDDYEDYSKQRLAPMIRDTKVLRDRVRDPKSRDSSNTIRQKKYPGGIMTLCGSLEAHSLASKPIRYLFGDERDRWAASAGSEGDPWELARRRQKTFYNAKAVEVSTPTIKGSSVIAEAYATGTMERYKTQCPHCGVYNEIDFESIRFEKTESVVAGAKHYEVTSVCYTCPSCGGISSESDMKKQPSRWEPENPDAIRSGTRSFWLSAWVSPWAPWEGIILNYLNAIGNPEKMKVVYNTDFGKLWEVRGDMEDEGSLMARREEYPAELPDGVLLLTMGVDTQDDRLEYEVVGHGHFWESWGIKRGVIMGRPDTDEVWQALDDVASHVFRFQNGVGLRVSLTFVDEGGHYTQDVRMRCRLRQGKKFFAIKGRGGDGVPYTSPPRKQKIIIGGRMLGMSQVFEIGVDAGKSMIMDNLRVQTPGQRYCHFPLRDDYAGAFFHSLLSEQMVYNPKRKNPWQWEKVPGHERNESLDCRNYALAAAKAMNPDWDALDRRLKGTVADRPVNVTNIQAVPQRRRSTAKHYDEW